jgi:diguanylate cyclase (GGDEF)-like protein
MPDTERILDTKRSVRHIIVTEFFARRPRALVTGLAIASFAIVSALKLVSGPDVVFSAVYLVPIVFTTWCLSVSAGLVMAAGSTLVLCINLSEAHKYLGAMVPFWNAAMNLGVFLIVIFILAEAKQLYQREQELSREDFLTGLNNRRAFSEALKIEVFRARRYRHQISIVYIDLDNFKQVDDRYGHYAGDLLLSKVADVLRSSVREVDVVARLGGDEFALLLPETDAVAVRLALNKIEKAVLEIVTIRGAAYQVSFSAGAVTFVKPLDSIEQMINTPTA